MEQILQVLASGPKPCLHLTPNTTRYYVCGCIYLEYLIIILEASWQRST